MPYFGCGFRNQSGMTPSSATRLRTPLEPMIAVLTAPARIRKPTTTTNALRHELQPSAGPIMFIARPLIRLSRVLGHAHVVGNQQHGQKADAGGEARGCRRRR